MGHHIEHYSDWLEHNGKTVLIDGIKHVIEVSTIRAIYPYRHTSISVYARPVNRKSKFYQDTKAKLGDDWSTDVLSSPELQCEILNQLEGK
jgi:hypothetical protein